MGKLATAKKVVLHIFNYVLDLPLALGIGLMAEHRLEAMFPYQSTETGSKHQIAKVFLNQKQLILIINYFVRHSPEVLEAQFVSIDSKSRSKRGAAKIDEVIPAATQ